MKPCPLNLGCRLLAQDLSSLNHLAFSWNGRWRGEGRKRVAKRMGRRGKKPLVVGGRTRRTLELIWPPTYPSLPTASSLFFSFLTLTPFPLLSRIFFRRGKQPRVSKLLHIERPVKPFAFRTRARKGLEPNLYLRKYCRDVLH